MDLLTALQRSGGLDALARQAGIATPQVHAAARAVLPEMLAAFRNLPGGRAGLLAEFERHGGASLAAAVMAMERADAAPGKTILAHVPGLGNPALAEKVAQAGVAPEPLLPLLVMLAVGYMSAMAAGHGAGPQGLDALLGYVA